MRVGAPRKERIRRLGDRDLLVAGGFQEVDQPEAVIPQQQRVGVEGQDIGGVLDDQVIRADGSTAGRSTVPSAVCSRRQGAPSG